MPAPMMPAAAAQPQAAKKTGAGTYYKDVIAAKKEIVTATKELKVHKIDEAAAAMQKVINLLMPYCNN